MIETEVQALGVQPEPSELDITKTLCRKTRENFMEIAIRLHRIREMNWWEGRYTSFSDFTDDCQLSRSFVTKLLKVYEEYALKGQISREALDVASCEKLYEAIPLLIDKSPQEVLNMAVELNSSELRDAVRGMKGECAHTDLREVFRRCVCGKFIRVHDEEHV